MQQILSAEQIQDGVRQLAKRVTETYGDRPITIVGILTSSLVLLVDLMRELEMPIRVALIQAHRYRSTLETEKGLEINDELIPELRGREVLVVDDMFDTGHTLVEVIGKILECEPLSLRTAVLMRKKERSEVPIHPDFVVFEVPDEFVVGYGLDYEDRFRNLPYIAALEPEDLA